jgi:hypothetical protein
MLSLTIYSQNTSAMPIPLASRVWYSFVNRQQMKTATLLASPLNLLHTTKGSKLGKSKSKTITTTSETLKLKK